MINVLVMNDDTMVTELNRSYISQTTEFSCIFTFDFDTIQLTTLWGDYVH